MTGDLTVCVFAVKRQKVPSTKNYTLYYVIGKNKEVFCDDVRKRRAAVA